MKKVFASFLAIAVLLVILAVPVLADSYITDNQNFSAPYEVTYYARLMTARYNTGDGISSYVRASTDVTLADDQIGISKVTLTANNDQVSISNTPYVGTWGHECGNVLNSGKATVAGQREGRSALHTVWRAPGNSGLIKYEVFCE